MVNVLVIGSGGREHALGWKLSQSSKVDKVYTAPGNGGTLNNVNIAVDQIDELIEFADKNDCFTVVGPEAPLALGIVDKFKEHNLKIFGPTKTAAQLESSKIWAKNFMQRNDIPTATFGIFDDQISAIDYVRSCSTPLVVKADGLTAGKGVVVCANQDDAISAIDRIMVRKYFGNAGNKIVIEERIDGIEASYIALSDGNVAIPMATSQDHKRIGDNDSGPNTGGMGAYSPTPIIDQVMSEKIQKKIIDKTISSLKKENILFKGFLYAGIMIKDDEPFVLEFNVRMGDPECQPIIVRMDFDLYDYLLASYDGNLSSLPHLSWKAQSAVCVVLASKGYPESYPTNEEILGLNSLNKNEIAFHAGTKKENSKLLTNGGRVLGVTTLGDSLDSAITNAYAAVDKVSWPSKFFRHDIGSKGLSFS